MVLLTAGSIVAGCEEDGVSSSPRIREDNAKNFRHTFEFTVSKKCKQSQCWCSVRVCDTEGRNHKEEIRSHTGFFVHSRSIPIIDSALLWKRASHDISNQIQAAFSCALLKYLSSCECTVLTSEHSCSHWKWPIFLKSVQIIVFWQ